MNYNRRTLLKGSVAAGAMSIAVSAGLLTPKSVLAAWPKATFESTDLDSAINALGGNPSDSKKIKLKAPDIAENGAVVPVTITSNIDNTEAISILVAKNGQPLCATFNLGSNTHGYVSTRLKMSKTSDVVAVIKADGKLYSATKQVKVTIGGCGG